MDIIKIIREEYQRLYENNDWYNDEESLADKILNQKYGISTQGNKKEFDNRETSGKFIGNVNGDIPIYLNPKSLEGFDEYCRGVIMANGDLYMSKSFNTNHKYIFRLLSSKGILPVDYLNKYWKTPEKFIAIERIKNTNNFVPSIAYEDDQLDVVNKFFQSVQSKHPFIKLTTDFNQNNALVEIIKEELEDWFDNNEPSLADNIYNNKLGINADNDNTNDTYSQGEYIGSTTNSYNTTKVKIFLNPLSLNKFQTNCRGIVMDSGDLYLCDSPNLTHYNIIDFLSKKNIIANNMKNWYYRIVPTNFVAISRYYTSDEFVESESYFQQPEIFKGILEIFNEINKNNKYRFTIRKSNLNILANDYVYNAKDDAD